MEPFLPELPMVKKYDFNSNKQMIIDDEPLNQLSFISSFLHYINRPNKKEYNLFIDNSNDWLNDSPFLIEFFVHLMRIARRWNLSLWFLNYTSTFQGCNMSQTISVHDGIGDFQVIDIQKNGRYKSLISLNHQK
jgi:hypothetical protein